MPLDFFVNYYQKNRDITNEIDKNANLTCQNKDLGVMITMSIGNVTDTDTENGSKWFGKVSDKNIQGFLII